MLAGGHTIRDPEPKYGLAVTGAAHPGPAPAQGRRRGPATSCVLTKRLGTGLLVSGRRQGRTDDADFAAAIDQMRVAQPGGRRGARRGRRPLRHRHHRVRGARARARDGPRVRRPARRSRRRRCRCWPARSSSPRAGVETGGAAHNRRFVAASLTVARRHPARAHDAGARPADERRPPRRGAAGEASPRSSRGSMPSRSRTGGSAGSRPRRRLGSSWTDRRSAQVAQRVVARPPVKRRTTRRRRAGTGRRARRKPAQAFPRVSGPARRSTSSSGRARSMGVAGRGQSPGGSEPPPTSRAICSPHERSAVSGAHQASPGQFRTVASVRWDGIAAADGRNGRRRWRTFIRRAFGTIGARGSAVSEGSGRPGQGRGRRDRCATTRERRPACQRELEGEGLAPAGQDRPSRT